MSMIDSDKNQNELEIMWKQVKNGAQILRVYGNSLEVTIPENIEGIPVTEIGAYCFSSSEHLPSSGYYLTAFSHSLESEQEQEKSYRIGNSTMPSISGKYVEHVTLPSSVVTLHNAAFYNCRNLKMLSVGCGIRAIGSDEFMNCINLKRLIVRGQPDENTGLSLILERLTTDVEVHFPEKCVLFFPEYYEWLNEITAAHIFSRSIEGEGFRMRHSFTNQCLDFAKYDQCFSSVLARETDRTIGHIALNRIRYPIGLSQDAANLYERAIRDRFSTVIQWIVKQKDFGCLQFLCDHFTPQSAEISQWMEYCIREEWSEGNAYLMERRHKASSFAQKSFDFDDF